VTENNNLELTLHQTGSGVVCQAVLAELPQWFGIPEANADYAATADREPTIVASIASKPVGLLTLVRHSDESAEIYLIAVVPGLHRGGIGLAMLERAEAELRGDGVRFLQVKTLAATSDDPNYAKTRQFYVGTGFVELEVFPTLWDPSNPALQMIKHLGD